MSHVGILCITANIGSLADDSGHILHPWTDNVIGVVEEIKPDFVALHLQNSQGNRDNGFSVSKIAEAFEKADSLQNYNIGITFADEDSRNDREFTGLASIYIARNSQVAQIFDFKNKDFRQENGFTYNGGDLQRESRVVKQAFQNNNLRVQDLNTRNKGSLRTRWLIHGVPVNFVNIHLFGNGSNIEARKKFPSIYAEQRGEALENVLKNLEPDFSSEPVFIAGDLNVRLDLCGLLEEISNVKHAACDESCDDKDEVVRLDYYTMDGKAATVDRDSIDFHRDQNWLFNTCNGILVKKHDRELSVFREVLREPRITFRPS